MKWDGMISKGTGSTIIIINPLLRSLAFVKHASIIRFFRFEVLSFSINEPPSSVTSFLYIIYHVSQFLSGPRLDGRWLKICKIRLLSGTDHLKCDEKRWSSNPLSGSDFEPRNSSQLEIDCRYFMKIQ